MAKTETGTWDKVRDSNRGQSQRQQQGTKSETATGDKVRDKNKEKDRGKDRDSRDKKRGKFEDIDIRNQDRFKNRHKK